MRSAGPAAASAANVSSSSSATARTRSSRRRRLRPPRGRWAPGASRKRVHRGEERGARGLDRGRRPQPSVSSRPHVEDLVGARSAGSDIAPEKRVAKKSSAIVETMIGVRKTKRSPSTSAWQHSDRRHSRRRHLPGSPDEKQRCEHRAERNGIAERRSPRAPRVPLPPRRLVAAITSPTRPVPRSSPRGRTSGWRDRAPGRSFRGGPGAG